MLNDDKFNAFKLNNNVTPYYIFDSKFINKLFHQQIVIIEFNTTGY